MMRAIDDVLNRLRAEFLEMPGLRLTTEQVQRLCGLDRTIAQMALDALVAEGLLCLSADGHFRRSTQGAGSRYRARVDRPVTHLRLPHGTSFSK